ncbi:PLC-like phosphodiesterase, TIM beta/alpha-barrel domain [Pseudocohnilembus persalinus]|uniref:Phosphoinositide phospholipase C n=1 Tax=Pseudocohnilembus persalinus TaxID=266149 RepID=A0A0V0R262_PSEPJ|nr:PLC-like phosphodiesterase, TIM beta/alpha-barrel domain [Pseudocohnilembus persalinus]|eukprot:KRX08587.1 PLC-like phosphodiesterase, TIM beta/alpha-barrel domain [Pseudocohnilembus persalinus]
MQIDDQPSKKTQNVGDVFYVCFQVKNEQKEFVIFFETQQEKFIYQEALKLIIDQAFQVEQKDKQYNYVKQLASNVFNKADSNKDKVLSLKELGQILKYMKLEVSKQRLQEIFHQFDADHSNNINVNEFQNILKELYNKQELKMLYEQYCKGNQSMSSDSLKEFMVKEQKLQVNIEELEKQIQQSSYQFTNKQEDKSEKNDKQGQTMDFYQFSNYIFSMENQLFNPEKLKVYQNMERPLTDYYICSSHNTYLTSNQLTGSSDASMYKNVLLRGCRCVELDTWDGAVEPVVTHGHTLTSKISLRECLKVLNRYAFEFSPYPLILSFENHCSKKQTHQIAQMCEEIFGDQIYKLPLNYDKMDFFRSPLNLKYKIIIKSKAVIYNVSDFGMHESYVNEFKSEEDFMYEKQRVLEKQRKQQEMNNKEKLAVIQEDLMSQFQSQDGSVHQSQEQKNGSNLNFSKNSRFSIVNGSRKNSRANGVQNKKTDQSNVELNNEKQSYQNVKNNINQANGKQKEQQVYFIDQQIYENSLKFHDQNKFSFLLEGQPESYNDYLNQIEGIYQQEYDNYGDLICISQYTSSSSSSSSSDDQSSDKEKKDKKDKKGKKQKEKKQKKNKKKDKKEEKSKNDKNFEKQKTFLSIESPRLNKKLSEVSQGSSGSQILDTSPGNKRGPEEYLLANITALFGIKFSLKVKERLPFHISSINEDKVKKLYFHKDEEIFQSVLKFHRQFFSREYPKGTRTNSSNYNSMYGFYIGCQIIALNFQTYDLNLMVYMSKFYQNGGINSGYVLKPKHLRSDWDSGIYYPEEYKLKIQIISGQNIIYDNQAIDEKSKIEPYIQIEVKQPLPKRVKHSKNKRQVTIKRNKEFNNVQDPVFNNTKIEYEIFDAELAMVCFSVRDANYSDRIISWYALPFECMRQGYRVVPLQSEKMITIPHSYLFLHVEICDFES